MASAVALKYLANRLRDKEVHIALGGIVGRAENRAMRIYLNIELVPVSEVRFNGDVQIALVDTQPADRTTRCRTMSCQRS
jgi:nanoRNase/pAp phosphatase (c-di-AMP/oligoRNAs hydrolase)